MPWLDQVAQNSLWAEVGRTFRPPPTMTALSFIFKRNYTQALLDFEKVHKVLVQIL